MYHALKVPLYASYGCFNESKLCQILFPNKCLKMFYYVKVTM